MPLDAICLSAVVRETAAQAENTRIEKNQQPAWDQVVLMLRGGRRLLLCAGATQPRLHLTEQLRDNPSQPPMFCMNEPAQPGCHTGVDACAQCEGGVAITVFYVSAHGQTILGLGITQFNCSLQEVGLVQDA